MNTRKITRAGVIAAIYILLILFQFIMPENYLTWGAVQLRIAEGLTILPFVDAAAVPGLFVGCLLSNLILSASSGLGLVDIIGGSLVTLIAAYLSSKAKNKYSAMIYPVILNGLIVSTWVSYYTNYPYILTVVGISGGEAASVLLFGTLFLAIYERAMKGLNSHR